MTKSALVWNAPDHIPNDYEERAFRTRVSRL
jgi:hypothetical protein